MLYSCSLVASTKGQELVQYIAELTGTDVAASSDSTGIASNNWDLEYSFGIIESEPLIINSYDNSLVSYIITNTSDSSAVENSLP